MGNRLGEEGAGAGAIIGLITGGPIGAVIGAAAGGVGGHIVDEVGRPIEEPIKREAADKSWTIGAFIDQEGTCGLNAINMSLRIWGYDKQMALNHYSYKYPVIDAQSARWGLTGQEMYDYNIKNTFDYAPDPI